MNATGRPRRRRSKTLTGLWNPTRQGMPRGGPVPRRWGSRRASRGRASASFMQSRQPRGTMATAAAGNRGSGECIQASAHVMGGLRWWTRARAIRPGDRGTGRPGRGGGRSRRELSLRTSAPGRPTTSTPVPWPSPATSARPRRKHASWKEPATTTSEKATPARPPGTCSRHYDLPAHRHLRHLRHLAHRGTSDTTR